MRKRIIIKLLELPHVEDVNLEFIEADETQDWVGETGPSVNINYKKE